MKEPRDGRRSGRAVEKERGGAGQRQRRKE